MAAERFSLLLESTTRGTEEVRKLEEALQKVMATAESTGKRTAASMKSSSDSVRQQADSLKTAIQNPLQAAGDAAESFALRFGKVGVAAVGVTAGIAAAGTVIFNLANATQNLAEQQTNAALILGLSIKDYGLFSQAAKNAGVDSGLLTQSMRGLAKALSDSSEEGKAAKRALSDIGVSATDSYGQVRPTRDLFLGIADALGKIESPAQRADTAVKVFGRSGLGLLPLFNAELRDSVANMERLGVGFDDVAARKANRFGNALDEQITKLDVLKRKAGEASIAILELLFPNATKTRKEKDAELDDAVARGWIHRTGGQATAAGLQLQLSPSELRRGAYSGGILRPAPGADQAFSMVKQNAESIIARLRDEKDNQSRLTAARKDLAEAERDGDVTAYRAAQSRVERLEAAVKATQEAQQKAKQLRESTEKLYELLGMDALRAGLGMRSNLMPVRPAFDAESLGTSGTADRFVASVMGGNMPGNERNVATGFRPSQDRSAASLTGDLAGARQQDITILRQSVDLQAQRIQLLVGPGGEVAALQRIRDIRLAALGEEKQLGGDVFQLEMEQYRTREEYELRILELKKRQRDAGRNTAESLFDAAVSGGQGLRSFVTSQALAIPRAVAGNLGAEMGGLTGKLSLGLGGVAGRLLQGTPFGADPLKNATDLNTQATVQNTQALLSMQGVGGGTAGIGGAIMSGATSIPGIFRMSSGAPVIGGHSGLGGFDSSIWQSPYVPVAPVSGKYAGLSKGIGAAGLIAGGAIGAYSGFSAGGAQGALTGTSSLMGMTAGLLSLSAATGPAAPFVAAGAMALAGIAALLGDPKQKRARGMQEEADRRRWDEPLGVSYSADIYGRQMDYDYRGTMRPIVVNNYINAIDTQSFEDVLQRNGVAVTDAVTGAIAEGNGEGLVGTLRQAM